MDRLWAPWRIKYVQGRKSHKCIFCNSLKSKGKNYIIFKNRYAFSLLNIFPYNNGHMMVSPVRHVKRISQLSDAEILDLFRAVNKTTELLDLVLKPEGYNIGINVSRVAGAGEERHLHIHIVPRWMGDVNFMPTVFGTKVISQSLDELYKRLKNAYAKANS